MGVLFRFALLLVVFVPLCVFGDAAARRGDFAGWMLRASPLAAAIVFVRFVVAIYAAARSAGDRSLDSMPQPEIPRAYVAQAALDAVAFPLAGAALVFDASFASPPDATIQLAWCSFVAIALDLVCFSDPFELEDIIVAPAVAAIYFATIGVVSLATDFQVYATFAPPVPPSENAAVAIGGCAAAAAFAAGAVLVIRTLDLVRCGARERYAEVVDVGETGELVGA